MNDKYSAEILELFRQYWENPESSLSKAPEVLGITKNTLIGLAHRNDWPLRRAVAAPSRPRPTPHFDTKGCAWPHGDPVSAEFRFCNERIHPGRPYCRPHCEKAYIGFNPERAATE